MSKSKASFVCNSCGALATSWSGKCFSCGEWDTITEEIVIKSKGSQQASKLIPASLKKAVLRDSPRMHIGIESLDEVFGGGVVPGSVVLLAGQPGIGKSTLLIQLADKLSQNKVLYISGEESEHQVASRAKRLEINSDFDIVCSQSAESVVDLITNSNYKVVIVDSIQTMQSANSTGISGGVSQIMSSTYLLTEVAKKTNTAIILVGHVTKEGSIAGPKILEHLVDVVMQLEGDKFADYKVLRSIKNRYGSVDVAAILEMTEKGLYPVLNPSKLLLEQRVDSDGSVIYAAMEGNKPLLIEIQALVTQTNYGYPKRTAVGVSLNRLNLLVAILSKRTKLNLSDKDIYLSVAAGLVVNDPASDLAIVMAIASSAKGMKLGKNTIVYGEVGLGGEIRRVTGHQKRVKESLSLGFNDIVGPIVNEKSDKYRGYRNIQDALNSHLERKES